MRHLLATLLIICFSNSLHSQEEEVRKTIDTFFEAFHARDTIKLKTVFAKQMVLHTIAQNESGSAFSEESPSGFLKSIAKIPKNMKFEESLISYDIKIDGAMAHAWIPYVFYLNGVRSHSGVNSFQLFKDNGIWKITYCIDTRRK